jgi:hypothetical protein
MGYISLNKGKWLFPVPWKTGSYFSQKRLSEFETIKQEMKLPSNAEKGGEIKSGSPTIISPPFPRKGNDPPLSVNDFEDIEFTPARKYRKPIKKLAQWKLVIDEGDEMEFFTTKQTPLHLKDIITKKPKDIVWSNSGERKSGMSASALQIAEKVEEVYGKEESEKEEPIIEEPEKHENKIFLKVKDFAQSDMPKKLGTYGLIFVSTAGLLGVIIAITFLGLVFFAPELLVGGVEYVPKTNVSSNTTLLLENITSPVINYTKQIVVQPNPPSDVIQINLPPSNYVVPPTITPPVIIDNTIVIPPIVNQTNTLVTDEKGVQHDYTGVPSTLQYQTKYSCYWDLRAKGFGALFSAEAECNAKTTGLSEMSCACCHQIDSKACD